MVTRLKGYFYVTLCKRKRAASIYVTDLFILRSVFLQVLFLHIFL